MTSPSFPLPDDAVAFWSAKDGWPLRAVRLDPPADMPVRGSLLFLNGRADTLEKYAETMHDWASRGWHVAGFDWRGQGGSGRFVPAVPWLGHVADFEDWISDLADYAAQWRGQTPGPHVVIAHSMGGHLLMRAVSEHRIAADAVVLVAPMIGLLAGGIPHGMARRISETACAIGLLEHPVWPQRARTVEREAVLRARLTHSEERFAQEQAMRREHPELAMDAPSWGWLRAAYRSIDRLMAPGRIEGIDLPVLIVASRADRLVSAVAIEALAKRLPEAQVHFYGAEAAHEILREADPVRNDALARIDAFLEDKAPPRQAAAEGRE